MRIHCHAKSPCAVALFVCLSVWQRLFEVSLPYCDAVGSWGVLVLPTFQRKASLPSSGRRRWFPTFRKNVSRSYSGEVGGDTFLLDRTVSNPEDHHRHLDCHEDFRMSYWVGKLFATRNFDVVNNQCSG